MPGMSVRLGILILYGTASSWWMREYPSRETRSLNKFILATPVVIMNHLAPFLFSTTGFDLLIRLSLTFLTAWISNAKILAFCCNRGPLTSEYFLEEGRWTISQYAALLHLPIFPEKTVKALDSQRVGRNDALQYRIFQLMGKFAMILLVDVSHQILEPRWPWTELLYGWAIYGFMGLCMDASSFFAYYFLELQLLDNFNHPYLADSLTDFWSRWNKLTGLLLKCLSFDIVMEGRIVREALREGESRVRCQRSTARVGVAVVALFVLSGVMHEMLYWYVVSKMIGYWFLFFTSLGFILLIERICTPFFRELSGVKSLPKPLGTVYVSFVLTVTASYLFTPQAEVGVGTNLSTVLTTALAPIKL